ncbi:DoxX family protein [Jeongeupia sp. HS-3]|uniref:DoxX family protein n=1 Tax=Jeongeupia sp. HS-3 TaxID=1009682 RepID=UPI00190FC956|nr:DoxX family protein [Jeongeupia sp. HS-3]
MNIQVQSIAVLIARALMALIFILAGLGKIGALAATAAYMEAMRVPAILLWPTIAFEVGAGILVLVGYQTRIAAALLAGFCLATAALFHTQFGDQIQMIMFLKNLAMAGGFIVLAMHGPGRFSLDACRCKDRSHPAGS